ncbi:MAG: type II toxin-antitoxin system PemK/MazF family toxin [Deltaproteobacteria bacterium]|nr:type II toxin-antitoxin system PemK/MazF family toxin [Deltaproteobacteria bacterium]
MQNLNKKWLKKALLRFPITLELQDANFPKRSWVKISQIRTLSVKCLRKKIGVAKPEKINLIIEGLNEIIGG